MPPVDSDPTEPGSTESGSIESGSIESGSASSDPNGPEPTDSADSDSGKGAAPRDGVRGGSVGFSRFLGLPAAIAAGSATGLAVVLFFGSTSIGRPWAGATYLYPLTALLLAPLILVWLDMPGRFGHYGQLRRYGRPALAFCTGWMMLAGSACLAAFLAGAVADRLGMATARFLGIEPDRSALVILVLAVVTLNELVGTRAHSRASTVFVLAVAGGLLTLFALTLLADPMPWLGAPMSIPPSDPSTVPSAAASWGLPTDPSEPRGHQLLPVALLVATLWGPAQLLSRRPLLRDGTRQAVPAMLGTWLLIYGTGALGTWAVVRHPELLRVDVSAGFTWTQSRMELLFLGIGTALGSMALSQVLASFERLVATMVADGFFPRSLVRHRSERGIPFAPFALQLVGISVLAIHVRGLVDLGVAAATLLGASILLILPHTRRTVADAEAGALRLPLHPLFPMLALAIAVFLLSILPGTALFGSFGWMLLGLLFYVAHGRRASSAIRQRIHAVGELEEAERSGPRILVAVGEGPTFETLVRVGVALARERRAELWVLKVEHLIEQVPFHEVRSAATETLERLRGRLEPWAEAEIFPLVRVAPSIAEGILETVRELQADFLVLGWSEDSDEVGAAIEPVVEQVFPATDRPTVVVSGLLPTHIRRVLVASAGGPHAHVALELATALAPEAEEASVVNIVTPAPAVAKGKEALAQTWERHEALEQRRAAEQERASEEEPDDGACEDGSRRVPLVDRASSRLGERVVEATSVAQGLERVAGVQDVLLLGAAVDRLFGQTHLGGFPTEVARSRRGPTLVVKRGESVSRFWLRRLWERLSRPLPTLDHSERVRVRAQMRTAARADVDFYLLITLASAIATLGLMQSSAAVIIGAMLVAPLMSPILALGHAMVLGHLRLVRRSASSTLKGIGIALAVGAFFALLFPSSRITEEMMARGAPGLLDLLVALASGAAAAYAVSRQSVAAALPGVAIAAALVPPLCVSGFGLGASEMQLAGGALLLFTTNLCAIVLASAGVFLLLGFRPARALQGRWVWRSIRFALLALVVISIPLGLRTRDVIEERQVELRMAEIFRNAGVESVRGLDIREVRIERVRSASGEKELEVRLTVFSAEPLGNEDLRRFRDELQKESDLPVRVRMTWLKAGVLEVGADDDADD